MVEQADEDVLHVVAHIAGLGECGGIGYAEGYVEHPGNGACQKGLAGACLAYDDDVGLLDFDIVHVIVFGRVFQTFIVVVHSHRKHTFGILLSDDILVEIVFYLLRHGYGEVELWFLAGSCMQMFVDYLVGLVYAGVADECVDAGEHQFDLRLGAAAEAAMVFGSRSFRHYWLR